MACSRSVPDKGRPPAPTSRGLRLSDILTLRDETDTAGRLLLEDSASNKAIKRVGRAGVSMKTASSPYADTASRAGGLFNASAYEAFRHDLGQVLDGFAWLGDHLARRNRGERGTVQGLVDVSKLGLSLPLVVFRRADDPVPLHGSLPPYVASLFKASRGVFSAAVDMLNKRGPVPTTAPEVVRFADEEGHLRRPATGRVCAAPTRTIERTIGVILTGDGGDPAGSRLGELVDFDRLWAFYRLEEAFTRALDEYRFVLGGLADQGLGLDDPDRLFASTVEAKGKSWTFGEFTGALLDYVNEVQVRLNHALGRAGDARPLDFDDILRLL